VSLTQLASAADRAAAERDHNLLALGASRPHIAVVAVAADVITAAGVGDPTSLHPRVNLVACLT